MKTLMKIVLAGVLIKLATNYVHIDERANKPKEYGFIGGFIHGLFSWILLLCNWLDKRIQVYYNSENKMAYNVGYTLGSGSLGWIFKRWAVSNK